LEIIFILIPALAIPVIFLLGKEAILIFIDELFRKSYSKQNAKLSNQVKVQVAPPADIEANGNKNPEYERGIDQNTKNAPVENCNQVEIKEKNQEVIFQTNPLEYLNMKSSVYYVSTIVCYLIVVLMSIVVEDVSIFFGFIGATTGGFALWIGPGSFYIIGVHKKKVKLTTHFEKFAYAAAWAYVIIGFLVLIGLNVCNVINIIV